MFNQNLHTHSCYDDGHDTPEQMAQAAMEQGITTLGFSGHSPNPIDTCSMSPEGMNRWKADVRKLQKSAPPSLNVFLGIELDSLSDIELDNFDYIIGSVHYLCPHGKPIAIDASRQEFELLLQAYENNIYALIDAYCQQLETTIQKRPLDIVGHLDLVGKYNEQEQYYAFDDPAIISRFLQTVKMGIQQGLIFEINTGAQSRGYRSVPYPHPALLKKMVECQARLTISSDCHNRTNLTYGYAQALETAKMCGAKTLACLSKEGFIDCSIEQFI